jgi:tetratricopeptide (TPR) repeat protein
MLVTPFEGIHWLVKMSATAGEQAREALRLAEGEPGRSVTLASEAARLARAERDHAAAAVAERALGIAVLHLGDLDIAVAHLRAAVGLGRRARSTRLAAEARMTLAFVLNRRGRPRRALREIDAALAGLDGVERARAQAQRAAIVQQLGRLDEALSGYRAALPVLRRAGDRLWVQRVLSNRGVLHTFRHAYAAAEADLQEAERLCRALGLDLSAAFVQENLGFVHARRGDVPAALGYYDLAERSYRALHAQLGSLLADRSELLLSARLVSEARQAAAQAVAEFERERRRTGLPEARLLLARAATLDGDPASAVQEAQRAAREFARQERREWATLARFAALTARLASRSSIPAWGSCLAARGAARTIQGGTDGSAPGWLAAASPRAAPAP